jgi:hypothetical protein
MSDILISQAEADYLIKMEKIKVDDQSYQFPQMKGKLIIPLLSRDGRNKFMLDINISRLTIKATYQNRSRITIILVRLDLTSGKHTNPDGQVIEGSHMHLYKEGYADKWAIPVPKHFSDMTDFHLTLEEFMGYCNIVDPPLIQGSSV